jgi:hypothetical protein
MDSWNRRSLSRMVALAAVSIMFPVLLIPSASSAQTVLNLGPDSTGPSFILSFFSGLEATPVDGRELSSEFVFADDKYLEIDSGESEDNSFVLDLAFFGTHNSGEAGSAVFTGWVEDEDGNRTNGSVINTGAGGGTFGYQLSFSEMPMVYQIHRFQFTVTFPDISGSELTDTQRIAVSSSSGGLVSVKTTSVATEDTNWGELKAHYER